MSMRVLSDKNDVFHLGNSENLMEIQESSANI